jgi:hypothetical protein
MPTDTHQIVNKAWSFAHVLRDDGLSYMAYTEQITFKDRVDRRYLEPSPRLHQDQPWLRALLCPDFRRTLPRGLGASVRAGV